jgi:hypothetical protein
LSEEIETRLSDSFDLVEAPFGGRIGLNTAIMLYANFRHAGDLRAHANHPDWTIADWLRDPDCFEHALGELVRSVWAQHPSETAVLLNWLQRLAHDAISRDATRAANAGGEPLTPAAEAQEREGWEALWAVSDRQRPEAPGTQARVREAFEALAALERQGAEAPQPSRKRRTR